MGEHFAASAAHPYSVPAPPNCWTPIGQKEVAVEDRGGVVEGRSGKKMDGKAKTGGGNGGKAVQGKGRGQGGKLGDVVVAGGKKGQKKELKVDSDDARFDDILFRLNGLEV